MLKINNLLFGTAHVAIECNKCGRTVLENFAYPYPYAFPMPKEWTVNSMENTVVICEKCIKTVNLENVL